MLKLQDTVDKIPFIGTKYKELLSVLGVYTIEDLLYHFPVRHTDTSRVSQISELDILESKTIKCEIDSIRNIRTKYRKLLIEAKVSDESGSIDVIWFNQRFLTQTLKIGSEVLLNGKLNPNRNKPQLYSPTYEVLRTTKPTHLGTIVPIHPTTTGITTKWLRSRINFLLNNHTYLLEDLQDDIPQDIKNRYELINLKKAIQSIHFPKNFQGLKQSNRRLAFDELLNIQLRLLKQRKARSNRKASTITINNKIIKQFLDNLIFKPTDAQKRTIREILSDFNKGYPANRLIQGDVGCGKTLVAAAVSIPIIESGFQVAILAPTSILAKQHYETLKTLFKKSKIKIHLVTGDTKQPNKVVVQPKQRKFSTGLKRNNETIDLIIGTHALLHRHKELFKKLGLVIVDEQHRFGVKQRKVLIENPTNRNVVPHKITMTATPIPRSIALTLFGDLDISIIDEMPEGRLPTKTYLVPHHKRNDSYKWIEDKTKNSKAQVFWICPLIEESEKLQTKAVITEYKRLETEIYPDLKIDLLHGRFTEEEKNSKILRMREGKTDILVSTSVIEVGMDIQNANIIVIEGAERFGLAQLHQLRGRVGRKAKQRSWCFLFSSKNASLQAVKRLKYFSKVNDGLKVAEFDLENRGPGEVYGTRQAGIPDLKLANLGDIRMIKETREAAEEIINT